MHHCRFHLSKIVTLIFSAWVECDVDPLIQESETIRPRTLEITIRKPAAFASDEKGARYMGNCCPLRHAPLARLLRQLGHLFHGQVITTEA